MSWLAQRAMKVALSLASLFLFNFPFGLKAQTVAGWPLSGVDIKNSRFGAAENILNVSNVGTLQPQWIFTAGSYVTATPSVDATTNTVYFPDWAGNLFKLNAADGSVVWKHNVTEYGMRAGSLSRTTPTLAGGLVVFGVSGALGLNFPSPAYLNAVDPATGNLVWQLEVDSDTHALMTGSPVVYNNIIYVGVSSSQEVLTTPTFRGSLIAVSLATGKLLWQKFMVPANYSGGAIWSSTPVIDVARSQIYVTTGNNYLVPESVLQCEQAAGVNAQKLVACQAQSNLADSIVALDLATGKIKWVHRGEPEDNFITSCNVPGSTTCPDPRGGDYDFGAGANLFTTEINGVATDVVGAGQKSGVYWALDPDTGKVLWRTKVGPSGVLGGIEWGTAVDGQYVYVAIANSAQATYQLQPDGMTWNGGSWAALNQSTGAIVWQVPDTGVNPNNPAVPADSLAAVTVANGVLYVGSLSGAMSALDTSSGNTLWTFQAAGSVNAAPSVFNGVLYWGSGYHSFGFTSPIATASTQFYSFALPAQGKP